MENSQHFNEDLLVVNSSVVSFVLCFKANDYTGASNYVISDPIRMFSQETMTDIR